MSVANAFPRAGEYHLSMLRKHVPMTIGLSVFAILAFGGLVFAWSQSRQFSAPTAVSTQPQLRANSVEVVPTPATLDPVEEGSNAAASGTVSNTSPKFVWPISQAAKRVTTKPFGLHVDPKHSPVPLERFTGYHTGVDFETFPEEKSSDVAVNAVCAGKVLSVRSASGYGGVLVQSCKWNKKDITVIYGHLKLKSISVNVGDSLKAGQKIAILGKGYSNETDGERKHLHLGVHLGTSVNILGYVAKTTDLKQWVDFRTLKPSVR